jgi:Uncharacterized protein conserved in bacteria
MKFLLNENIPPSLSNRLKSLGYESIHIYDCGLTGKSDEAVIQFALMQGYIIITHDLDYSRIISLSGKPKPSVITIRQRVVSGEIIFESLRQLLPKVSDILISGALISVDQEVVRYRLLPLKRD